MFCNQTKYYFKTYFCRRKENSETYLQNLIVFIISSSFFIARGRCKSLLIIVWAISYSSTIIITEIWITIVVAVETATSWSETATKKEIVISKKWYNVRVSRKYTYLLRLFDDTPNVSVLSFFSCLQSVLWVFPFERSIASHEMLSKKDLVLSYPLSSSSGSKSPVPVSLPESSFFSTSPLGF